MHVIPIIEPPIVPRLVPIHNAKAEELASNDNNRFDVIFCVCFCCNGTRDLAAEPKEFVSFDRQRKMLADLEKDALPFIIILNLVVVLVILLDDSQKHLPS